MNDLNSFFKSIYKLSVYEINKRYEYLGEGISRIVYGVNDDWVVKIAKGIEGLYQNKVELYVYRHSGHRYRKYLCPIVWFRPDMIVMPRATPLSAVTKAKKVNLKTIRKEPEAYNDLLAFSKHFYMLFEDIESPSSWGILKEVPLLIDYGCTNEEGDRFYDSI